MKTRASILGLSVVLFAIWGGVAQAVPRFPAEIERDIQGSVPPACSVCHLGGKTAGITTVTPFVLALKARGFDGERSSLATALGQLDADGTDSDGDGTPDVAELRTGADPNAPVPQAPSADPSYGCSVAGAARGSIATHGAWFDGFAWCGGLLGVGAAILVKRRRRLATARKTRLRR